METREYKVKESPSGVGFCVYHTEPTIKEVTDAVFTEQFMARRFAEILNNNEAKAAEAVPPGVPVVVKGPWAG